jgi:hypothetical protein
MGTEMITEPNEDQDAFTLAVEFAGAAAAAPEAPATRTRPTLRVLRDDRSRRRARRERAGAGSDAAPQPATSASSVYERMVIARTSFWAAVYQPFMMHDLTRADVQAVVRRGLERTSGSYLLLSELFNLPRTDYERFLTFLHEYDCDVRAHDAL